MNELTDPDEQLYYILLSTIAQFDGNEYQFELWLKLQNMELNWISPVGIIEKGGVRHVYNAIREADEFEDLIKREIERRIPRYAPEPRQKFEKHE